MEKVLRFDRKTLKGGTALSGGCIRIDHFRGFESYWSVPCGKTTAKDDHWVKGPGISPVGGADRVVPRY